jgi:hypothetical protein
VSSWGKDGKGDYPIGRSNSPERCPLRDFVYRLDGTTGPTPPIAIGSLVEPRLKWRWWATHCAGCGRVREGRNTVGNLCGVCAQYAARGRRVDSSGGSWREGAGGYSRGAGLSIGVDSFVRHDPYAISEGGADHKTEPVLFTRSRWRPDYNRDWDPKKPQEPARAHNGHFHVIDAMLRSQHGRALLSRQHVLWAEARSSSKPRRKRPRPTQRPQDRRPTCTGPEHRAGL